jgi:hypothetical protein
LLCLKTPFAIAGPRSQLKQAALIHHQDIICGVACLPERAGVRSSLRRMVQYASLVVPRRTNVFRWRLASDAFLVIRNPPKSSSLFGSRN